MRTRFRLVMAGALALLGGWPAAASAQLDRSCNALQVVQQTSRVMRLPDGERQRYQGTIQAFEKEMNRLFDASRREARDFDKARNGHIERLVQARADLVEKYQNIVLRERPDLRRAEAQQEFSAEVWARLLNDREFTAALQRRLVQDPEYDRRGAAIARRQTEDYHDLERRQYEALQKIPPPRQAYEAQVAGTARAFLQQGQQGQPARGSAPIGAGVGQSLALQELVTAVAAGRTAARASLTQEGMEFAVAQSRLVFDRRTDPVVDATESLRGAVRTIEALRLRSTLDFQHADSFLPAPADRQAFMTAAGRQLPQAVAEMVSKAVQTRGKIHVGTRHLDRIEVPPPPPTPAPPPTWTQTVVDNVKKAAKKVEYILEE